MKFSIAQLFLVAMAGMIAQSTADFTEQDCENWASRGECAANPKSMLKYCKKQCEEAEKYDAEEAALVGKIGSFYDLSAKDIDGNVVSFSDFKDKVVIITNVASNCGYTGQHYKELVELHNTIKSSGRVEILAFPCNQFGEQEPSECSEIKAFAKKKGVEFRMMDKIDVNGKNAHLVYKYLKRNAGPNYITWNFSTYFVIAPSGAVHSHKAVTPKDLIPVVNEWLDESMSEL